MKKGQTGTGPKQATLPHDSKANGQHFGRRAKQSDHYMHSTSCNVFTVPVFLLNLEP